MPGFPFYYTPFPISKALLLTLCQHVKKNEVTIEGYMLYHTTMAKQLQGMEGEWKSENSVVTAEEAPGLIFE